MSEEPSGPITDVESAAARVMERLGVPLHERATIALLESEGLRDKDAGRVLDGAPDLFAVGAAVHARCLELSEVAATTAEEEPEEQRPAPVWKRLARGYWRGVAYFLPMVAQGAVLYLLGVSIWGSPDLGSRAQTALALALVASLVVSAPATHAMTRRLFYYLYQWDPRALRRTALRWTLGGIALGTALGALAAACLAATGRWDAAAAAFCIFLALQPGMWLANSTLFVIDHAWVAGLAVVAPVLPMWALLRVGVAPVAVHVTGIVLADALLVGGALIVLNRGVRGMPPARRPLPRTVLPLSVGGYATWGLVYFLLMFSDRVLAWTAGGDLAFRPSYEAALQVALLPLVLVLPLLEYVLIRFGALMRDAHRNGRHDVGAARERAAGTLVRLVAGCTAAYALLAGATAAAVLGLGPHLPLGAGALVSEREGRLTLLAALVAYGLFTVALGVCTAYQLLARPWPMVAVGAGALVVDVVVGRLAQSAWTPNAAVAGLVAGGLVFAVGMAVAWSRDRRRLAHLWYAAG